MVYLLSVIFIETPIFEEDIQQLMPDEAYAEFQQHLADQPDVGNVVQGTGGIRKVRWKLPGTDKSGGVRMIYYRRTAERIRSSCCWSTRRPGRRT